MLGPWLSQHLTITQFLSPLHFNSYLNIGQNCIHGIFLLDTINKHHLRVNILQKYFLSKSFTLFSVKYASQESSPEKQLLRCRNVISPGDNVIPSGQVSKLISKCLLNITVILIVLNQISYCVSMERLSRVLIYKQQSHILPQTPLPNINAF